MSQIIDLSSIAPQKRSREESIGTVRKHQVLQYKTLSEDDYKLTLNVLIHTYPNKTNFTIEEVALHMRVSAEFVRRRIKSGLIRAVYFGDKPTVPVTELAKLLTEGIK